MLIASLDDEAQQDLRDNKNFNTYKGAIYENIVADMLVKQGYGLYFFRNEKSTIEMDFFVRDIDSLIPVEVKANDCSLSEMYVKATAHGIAFDLIVGEELYYLVNNIISQTDLQTLLCDHIKDAVIAVTAAKDTNGKILVTIEKNDGLFEISIRDNGIEFTPDTLAKLGRERITTHADEGGSGIGFMTTFETLAKTKGSLIITEYEAGSPFTKAVTFVFDGLHRFVIETYRKDDLKEIVTRDDVILL